MIKIVDGRGKTNKWVMGQLNRRSHLEFIEEKRSVENILTEIKKRGEAAVLDFTSRFDGVSYTGLSEAVVTQDEIDEAYQKVDTRLIEILKRAKERIWNFHAKQKQNTWISFEDQGVVMGQKIQPLERVGVYVPGGRAAYPSSVLMNIIPAKVAGVEEIVMVTPPQPDGKANPNTIVAADIAGADKIFKIGGAQAVGALAFGIGMVEKVDKIVGPGNIYVTLAKKEVYGYVDIDMIAGPSEVLVLADDSANPVYVAADLLSQAEHDPMASSILITTCEDLVSKVQDEISNQLAYLSTKETIKSSLKDYGNLIIVETIQQGIDLANKIAPEHMELALKNPFDWLGQVKHAGAIFLGHYSPEPLGDYMAGPNHVLPTSGTARFFSPLSVDDFIKKSSIISFNKGALEGIYKDVVDFAQAEGLAAHANSMEVRFKK